METIYIYVINLPHRIDRKKNIIESFKQYPQINLIFVDGVLNTNGAIGCFIAHQKCLNIAKNKNLDYIIVMEDDTIPKPDINFYEELVKSIDFLKLQSNWNLFLGVANKVRYENIKDFIISDNITCAIVDKAYIFSLVIYNKQIYDFFLNANLEPENFIPIDKYWNYKFNALVRIPFIVETYRNYSDIVKKNTNYSQQFQNTENFIIDHIKNNYKIN